MNSVGLAKRWAWLVVGVFLASGLAAAEDAPESQPVEGTAPAEPSPAVPVEGAEPAPAVAIEGDVVVVTDPPLGEEDDEAAKHERMKRAWHEAAKELRQAAHQHFKDWKQEQRAAWQAEKEELRAAYAAQVREVRAWWEEQVAAWHERCTASAWNDAPAAGNGTNGTEPNATEPAPNQTEPAPNQTEPAPNSTAMPGNSACGHARATINHQAHERLRAAREEARAAKHDLDEAYREQVRAHLDEALDDLRAAIEDRLLDLQAAMAFEVADRLERGLRRAVEHAREAPKRGGAACDADGVCTPPPECAGRIGATAECTPPPVCKDRGDGTYLCPSARDMAKRLEAALGDGALREKMKHAWEEAAKNGWSAERLEKEPEVVEGSK